MVPKRRNSRTDGKGKVCEGDRLEFHLQMKQPDHCFTKRLVQQTCLRPGREGPIVPNQPVTLLNYISQVFLLFCPPGLICTVTTFIHFLCVSDLHSPEQGEGHLPLQCHISSLHLQPVPPHPQNRHQDPGPLISLHTHCCCCCCCAGQQVPHTHGAPPCRVGVRPKTHRVGLFRFI